MRLCRPGWQFPLFITAEPEVKSHTAEILPFSQTEIMLNFFHGHPTIYRSKEMKKVIWSKCSLFTPSPFPKSVQCWKYHSLPKRGLHKVLRVLSSSQIKSFWFNERKIKTKYSKIQADDCFLQKSNFRQKRLPCLQLNITVTAQFDPEKVHFFQRALLYAKKGFEGFFHEIILTLRWGETVLLL